MKIQTFLRRNAGVWLVLPSFLLILLFVYFFIAYTGWTSLTDLNQLQMEPGKFIGTINYSELLQNPRFQIDIRNTVIFSLIFIPGCLIIGLGSALLIQSGIKGEGLFRTIYLAPMAISFIVTGVVWRCRNCGFLYTGTDAPEECPACAHPRAHFELLGENY